MKVTVKKSVLEVVAKNLCKVINTKNALPILGDILVDVQDNKTAYLTASDSEVWLRYWIALDDQDGCGRFCVDAKNLVSMLGEISEQPVNIETTDGMTMQLTYEDGEAHCAIDDANEYPAPIEIADDLPGVTLNARLTKRAISRCVWTTASDELRPIMAGIHLDLSTEKHATIVASDGHSLMMTEIVASNYENGGITLPRKAAALMTTVIDSESDDDEDEFDMTFSATQAQMQMGAATLTFRLIEGNYPKYRTIIPESNLFEVAVERLALLSALKAVAPFAPGASNMVELTFNAGTVDVKGNDLDFSRGARKTVGTDGYTGYAMTIGMKASKVIGILSKMSSDSVWLKLNSPDRAITFAPVLKDGDSADETITALAMPMLVNG